MPLGHALSGPPGLLNARRDHGWPAGSLSRPVLEPHASERGGGAWRGHAAGQAQPNRADLGQIRVGVGSAAADVEGGVVTSSARAARGSAGAREPCVALGLRRRQLAFVQAFTAIQAGKHHPRPPRRRGDDT